MKEKTIAKMELCAAVVLGVVSVVAAAPVAPQSPINPIDTWENPQPPAPLQVPGKEYSNDIDRDKAGTPDPLQNVRWDGAGSVWDTFDYSPAGVTANGDPPVHPCDNDQVDALGNTRDKFFLDLVADRISLLVSFDGVGDIHIQRPALRGDNKTAMWAKKDTNINSTAPPEDVDGLEVWGPADLDDANIFSLYGDPVVDGKKVSVFKFNAVTGESDPYLLAEDIAPILINDAGQNPGLSASQIDLDAMLIWDVEDDDTFNTGDKIIFSIKAVGASDGGEVWVYNHGAAAATFLNHGNTLWNTAHAIAVDFGVGTEEVNALEALPKPATLSLIGVCSLVLIRRRR